MAQLVERLLCKQNVAGSNPATSTKGGRERHRRSHRWRASGVVGRPTSFCGLSG